MIENYDDYDDYEYDDYDYDYVYDEQTKNLTKSKRKVLKEKAAEYYLKKQRSYLRKGKRAL